MSKILITGGAGYIGSMLCTKLLEEGHTVTSVDLLKYDKGSLNHLYHKNEQALRPHFTRITQSFYKLF